MRQAIRALGWASALLWILVILFSGTVVYSAMGIGLNFEEEPEITASNGTTTISIPFSIDNDGLYDISGLNITTRILGENETAISSSTSLVPLIPKNGVVRETHDISLSTGDILAKELTHMLFEDADLNVTMFVGLSFAEAIPIEMSSDLTMPWGAPLYNLTIGEITVVPQTPDLLARVPLNFENHAFFGFNGTIRLEIVDGSNELLGSGTTDIDVPSGGGYGDAIVVTMTGDPGDVAEAHLHFDTSAFSFGPVVTAID